MLTNRVQELLDKRIEFKSWWIKGKSLFNQVSEAYALHRQTFYLAQDYFDRFMLTQANIEKGTLQLIYSIQDGGERQAGSKCQTKIQLVKQAPWSLTSLPSQEASPPKVSQMAYMTAGTCCEEEILQMELIILKVMLLQVWCIFLMLIEKEMPNFFGSFSWLWSLYVAQALGWNLCPETAVSWLKLYFQTASMNKNIDLLTPQFPRDVYVQMTHVGVWIRLFKHTPCSCSPVVCKWSNQICRVRTASALVVTVTM